MNIYTYIIFKNGCDEYEHSFVFWQAFQTSGLFWKMPFWFSIKRLRISYQCKVYVLNHVLCRILRQQAGHVCMVGDGKRGRGSLSIHSSL